MKHTGIKEEKNTSNYHHYLEKLVSFVINHSVLDRRFAILSHVVCTNVGYL